MKTLGICFAVVALSSAAFAEGKAPLPERDVQEEDVPKVVLDKVRAKYKNAKLLGFEEKTKEGKTAYEVKISDGDRKLGVTCYADGQIRSEADKVAIEAVPEKVRAAWKADATYGAWTLHHAEHVIRFEKTAEPHFKIKVTQGDKMAKLEYSADGKLLSSEVHEWHARK